MTREQMAAELSALTESWHGAEHHAWLKLIDPMDVATLKEIAAYLRQCCATCQHADTENAEDGWCFCACPFPSDKAAWLRFPFYGSAMPLDEKCKGWTAKEPEA